MAPIEDWMDYDLEDGPEVHPRRNRKGKKKKKKASNIDIAPVIGLRYKNKRYIPTVEFSLYIGDVCSGIFTMENEAHPSVIQGGDILFFRVIEALKEAFDGKLCIDHTLYGAKSPGYPDQVAISATIPKGNRNHSIIMGFFDKRMYNVKDGNEKFKDAADEHGRILYYSSFSIYYSPEVSESVFEIIKILKDTSGTPSKRGKPTIEMIAVSRELYTKTIELDFEYDPDENLEIHYGEGFGEFDKALDKRIEAENKGIIMLYGPPGTGKTHYIRRLISRISKEGSKRIILIPKHILEQIEGPQFNNFMTNNFMNSDALFVIEDAESIISERSQNGDGRSSLVSTLLNISDGILNDIFKIQVVLTFNTELSNIDKALLRPGRLMAQRYFGPLDKVRSQILIDHLGIDHKADEDMTVAEIYALNSEEQDDILMGDLGSKERNKIGF